MFLLLVPGENWYQNSLNKTQIDTLVTQLANINGICYLCVNLRP